MRFYICGRSEKETKQNEKPIYQPGQKNADD